MAAAGRGRVLVTASIVDAFPGPHQAAYNASKAFARSFGIGLRHELRERGVSVTVLEPGPTDTPIFAKADQETTLLAAATPQGLTDRRRAAGVRSADGRARDRRRGVDHDARPRTSCRACCPTRSRRG